MVRGVAQCDTLVPVSGESATETGGGGANKVFTSPKFIAAFFTSDWAWLSLNFVLVFLISCLLGIWYKIRQRDCFCFNEKPSL